MGESVNLGDFGFTNVTAGSSSFVFEESSEFFVRNNVFVRIRSDNQNLSALPLAQHIDDALLFFSTNNMADPGGGGTIFP